jgi:hypothetical protein
VTPYILVVELILICYIWSDAVQVGAGFWREGGREERRDPAGKRRPPTDETEEDDDG